LKYIHNNRCRLVEQQGTPEHTLRLNVQCKIFKQLLAETFSYRKVLLRSFSICRCGASLMKRVNSTRRKSPIKMVIREFRHSSLKIQNRSATVPNRLKYLSTLHKTLHMARRRVTPRLTRFQNMCK